MWRDAKPDPGVPAPDVRRWRVALVLLAVAVGAGAAQAERGGGDDGRERGRGDSIVRDRSDRSDRSDRNDRGDRRDRGDRGRWHDGAHGHHRSYPTPGYAVRVLPSPSRIVFWGGVGYHFLDGVWYTSGPRGYVVVRPPFGVVVTEAPPFATALTIAGVAYLYANGVYYRQHAAGGYEVVPPPVDPDAAGAPGKAYVYPRQGQDAKQQAADEYECHRWAVGQTGFDPSGAAVGQAPASGAPQRRDYERARTACLEGRGYTVR